MVNRICEDIAGYEPIDRVRVRVSHEDRTRRRVRVGLGSGLVE